MLGKQWLNRYDSSDMRGSAIERSHNRQRKLGGMATWSFGHVMESLPLMLQVALLLLGCALSRYLWEVSTLVALVVLGVTSIGMLFYIFIVIAGIVDESCPYQTPVSLALRYLGQNITGMIRHLWQKVINLAFGESSITGFFYAFIPRKHKLGGRRFVIYFHPLILLFTLVIMALDVCRFGLVVVLELVRGAYDLCRVLRVGKQKLNKQEAISDLSCISWTLQTSLDKDIRLLTVEYLETKTGLTYFDPTLVVDACFDVLIGCISISGRRIAIIQDKEQLATVSATCFLYSLHCISVTDPTSSIFADIRQRYSHVFPLRLDFVDLPFCHTMIKIHSLAKEVQDRRVIRWDDYRPSGQEYTGFARYMVEVAKVEYRRTQCRKVPRWILRFALHSLSLDPLPPVPVVADCLTIVAIDLGCQVSETAGFKERCVYIV